MKDKLKSARKSKGLRLREVAEALRVDASLVSKFEAGTRKPTRNQIITLAGLLGLDAHELLIDWLSGQIIDDIGHGDFALEVLSVAEQKVKYYTKADFKAAEDELKRVLKDVETLKRKLDKHRELDSYRVAQALELEYTFESNRIEGNTLSLKETDLVVNEGITISGKSMREHLEAINHQDAVGYLKELIHEDYDFCERDLLQIHALILKGIDAKNAGKYREVQVMIKGSRHLPPQPYLVRKQMEDLFFWYQINKKNLHPIILAAELSERLVTIHPFIDGNGRTSRLIMNLILLKNGYVIANIKGDVENRMHYYECLEKAQVDSRKEDFHLFIAKEELNALERYCSILGI